MELMKKVFLFRRALNLFKKKLYKIHKAYMCPSVENYIQIENNNKGHILVYDNLLKCLSFYHCLHLQYFHISHNNPLTIEQCHKIIQHKNRSSILLRYWINVNDDIKPVWYRFSLIAISSRYEDIYDFDMRLISMYSPLVHSN